MTSTIRVHVESEPHVEDLSGVILNRPLPQSGSFLISQRLDKALWSQMKAAGAWYLSADDLEEFDMFHSTPGWRYGLPALLVLVRAGYSLEIRGETVTTPEQLAVLFTPEAKAAYRARVEAERQAAAQAAAEQKRLEWHEHMAAGAAYALWKTETLAGLVQTIIAPPLIDGEWETVNQVAKDTPGAWYDTGDRWQRGFSGGQVVYRCYYGNGVAYYAPAGLALAWTVAQDDGSVAYARHVLIYHNYGVVGSDVADRLVALRGLDHYIARAASEPWLLIGRRHTLSRERDVAAHYGLVQTPVALHEYDRTLRELVQQLCSMLNVNPHDRTSPRGLGQTPDGQWWSTTDAFNGGGWQQLTAEQCTELGLSLTPPSPAPELPEARPLPTPEQTAERSARFSALFAG